MVRRFWIRCKKFLYSIGEGSFLARHCRDFTQNIKTLKLMMLLSAPYCLLRYFFVFPKKNDRRKGLAVALIAKNEAPYIKEWVEFHHKQGVSHFFIYDNESADNLHEVLKPYIDSGLVTYRLIRGRVRQRDAYNMALSKCRRKFKYMAILDADEFLFVRKDVYGCNYNLYEFVDRFMSSHKEAGGLAVNWCVFGSSGHITKPEGGVLENYTMRAEDDFAINLHIKTICDPSKTMCFAHVHYPNYRRGFCNFGENGEKVFGPFTKEVHFENIRINHYLTKSKEEYIAKRKRGCADENQVRDMSEFYQYERYEVNDTEILSHM